METTELIHSLEFRIRHLKQIQHFKDLRETALTVLNDIPDSMVKTSKTYRNRIENNED